jgi:hypothetical protein
MILSVWCLGQKSEWVNPWLLFAATWTLPVPSPGLDMSVMEMCPILKARLKGVNR